MDLQQIANAVLVVPALVLGVVAVRARRRGRTTLGLGLRGVVRPVLGGFALGAAGIAVLLGVLVAIGGLAVTGVAPEPRSALVGEAGILLYFAVLFAIEDVVFLGLAMTGLGVVAGRSAALVVTAVVTALPYAFSPTAGWAAVVGSILVKLVSGAARWRTGSIWASWALRMAWNGGLVVCGAFNSGLLLAPGLLTTHPTGRPLLDGGAFGPEAGVVGMAVCVALLAFLVPGIRERGRWQVRREEPEHARSAYSER